MAGPAADTDAEILFEATSTPCSSFDPALFAGLTGVAGAAALATAVLFTWLGAWPVPGFVGAELALGLGLVLVHRRRSARVRERVVLAGGRLEVTGTDHRGRRSAFGLDAYWVRVRLEERPGRTSALVLAGRGRKAEIGVHLREEEKADLAAALASALRRHREPVFDNPQLR